MRRRHALQHARKPARRASPAPTVLWTGGTDAVPWRTPSAETSTAPWGPSDTSTEAGPWRRRLSAASITEPRSSRSAPTIDLSSSRVRLQHRTASTDGRGQRWPACVDGQSPAGVRNCLGHSSVEVRGGSRRQASRGHHPAIAWIRLHECVDERVQFVSAKPRTWLVDLGGRAVVLDDRDVRSNRAFDRDRRGVDARLGECPLELVRIIGTRWEHRPGRAAVDRGGDGDVDALPRGLHR